MRIRTRVNVNADLFQETGFLQRLSAAQYGVAHDGIVLAQETWRQCLPDCLLLEESQRPETTVREEHLIRQTQLQTQCRE